MDLFFKDEKVTEPVVGKNKKKRKHEEVEINLELKEKARLLCACSEQWKIISKYNNDKLKDGLTKRSLIN